MGSSSPKFRGENEKILELPPPRCIVSPPRSTNFCFEKGKTVTGLQLNPPQPPEIWVLHQQVGTLEARPLPAESKNLSTKKSLEADKIKQQKNVKRQIIWTKPPWFLWFTCWYFVVQGICQKVSLHQTRDPSKANISLQQPVEVQGIKAKKKIQKIDIKNCYKTNHVKEINTHDFCGQGENVNEMSVIDLHIRLLSQHNCKKLYQHVVPMRHTKHSSLICCQKSKWKCQTNKNVMAVCLQARPCINVWRRKNTN